MFLSGFLRQSFNLRDAESLVGGKNGITFITKAKNLLYYTGERYITSDQSKML
jgi:hypothetical protein